MSYIATYVADWMHFIHSRPVHICSSAFLQEIKSDVVSLTKLEKKKKTNRQWAGSAPSKEEASLLNFAGDDQDEGKETPTGVLDALSLRSVEDVPEMQVANAPSSGSYWISMFEGLVGQKDLTSEDLSCTLKKMKDILLQRNVAEAVADQICVHVEHHLLGKKTGSFQSARRICLHHR